MVLINWNGCDDTIACLESLQRAEPGPTGVIVVENASTDNSLQRLREWCSRRSVAMTEVVDDVPLPPGRTFPPGLVIIRLGRHRGFAGGNNAGIRLLQGCPDITHFLLLNNDTEVAPDYFAELRTALLAAPDAGLLSGTIYEYPQLDRVWYAGGVDRPWRALVLHRYDVPADAAPRSTEFITGCALVIARRTVDAIGLLPEQAYHPAYVEDAEYSLRARRAGLPVLYAPRPVVYHKVSSTTGGPGRSPWVAYLYARNRVVYVRRNLRGVQRATALAYLVITKPGRALLELLRGRPALGRAILRGTIIGMFSRVAGQ